MLMTIRKFVKVIVGLLLVFAIAASVTAINHPIVLKWLCGTARIIGKPVNVEVYTNGRLNHDIKVFHVDKYWGTNKHANNYLLSLTEYDSVGKLKFFNINLDQKWIGRPASISRNDYDFVIGRLVQSETGGHFVPFDHPEKGYNFDPQLSFTDHQIKFNVPPNTLKFDSVRIEIR
jgi:hypothetical protein